MYIRPFSPIEGKTTVIANSASATAAVAIPFESDVILLSNSSLTATVFVRITYYDNANDTMTGAAPTTTTDYPILPNSRLLRSVQAGRFKVIRTIASAADANLYVTPGSGN